MRKHKNDFYSTGNFKSQMRSGKNSFNYVQSKWPHLSSFLIYLFEIFSLSFFGFYRLLIFCFINLAFGLKYSWYTYEFYFS
jgi:hypothetical protein